VGLREARLKRDEININREKGVPPRAEAGNNDLSFENVALEWLEKRMNTKAQS
jgi:hypothetical protein